MRHESQQNPHVLFADAFGAAGVDSHCAGWDRGKVERFATLPPGEAHPEGIAVDRDGNVYVVTVAANKPETAERTLIVFDSQGKHLRTVNVAGSKGFRRSSHEHD